MIYIGLDFETSGSDPWGRSVPIQIGMAVETTYGSALFSRYIGGWKWESNYNDPTDIDWWDWSDEAEAVHGIPRDHSSLRDAEPVWAVDIRAAAWLLDFVSTTKRMSNIAVGWNVGAFDRQFVTRWMPNLNRLLSYRTLDLNALVMGLAGDEKAYKSIKEDAKQAAHAELALTNEDRHDALVDANCALAELRYLKGWLSVQSSAL